MKCDPVALGVEDNGPETEGPDGLLWLKDLAAARLDGLDGVIQAAVDVQVHEGPLGRGLHRVAQVEAAGRLAVLVGKRADRHPGIVELLDLAPQYRGIEPDRTVQLQHGDIHPDNMVRHGRVFSWFSRGTPGDRRSVGPPRRARRANLRRARG